MSGRRRGGYLGRGYGPQQGVVYLLHFDEPYRHARHYTGWTTDLPQRLTDHREGRGARLMAVIKDAGIGFVLARTWANATRDDEDRIKSAHGAAQYCPACGVKPIDKEGKAAVRRQANRAKARAEEERLRTERAQAVAEGQTGRVDQIDTYLDQTEHGDRLRADYQARHEAWSQAQHQPMRDLTPEEEAGLAAMEDRWRTTAGLPPIGDTGQHTTAGSTEPEEEQMRLPWSRNATPAGPQPPEESLAPPGYYRADYSEYAPGWIPQPDGVSPATWDRYLAAKPGSRAHKAAYADMHREAAGRDFPGPDPDQSYRADHGTGVSPAMSGNPEPGYDADPEPGPADNDWPAALDDPNEYEMNRREAYYEQLDAENYARAAAERGEEEAAIGESGAEELGLGYDEPWPYWRDNYNEVSYLDGQPPEEELDPHVWDDEPGADADTGLTADAHYWPGEPGADPETDHDRMAEAMTPQAGFSRAASDAETASARVRREAAAEQLAQREYDETTPFWQRVGPAYEDPDRLRTPEERDAEPSADAHAWTPGHSEYDRELDRQAREASTPEARFNRAVGAANEASVRERREATNERMAEREYDRRPSPQMQLAREEPQQQVRQAMAERQAATEDACRAYARMQEETAGPLSYKAEPLPRVLDSRTGGPSMAPVAATLPDGTPHSDPGLAQRGWQAQGGVYQRQPQAQLEAG